MTGRIIGLGSYLPKKVVTNDDFAKFLDTSDEWITERTGIQAPPQAMRSPLKRS